MCNILHEPKDTSLPASTYVKSNNDPDILPYDTVMDYFFIGYRMHPHSTLYKLKGQTGWSLQYGRAERQYHQRLKYWLSKHKNRFVAVFPS